LIDVLLLLKKATKQAAMATLQPIVMEFELSFCPKLNSTHKCPALDNSYLRILIFTFLNDDRFTIETASAFQAENYTRKNQRPFDILRMDHWIHNLFSSLECMGQNS
jgi:hypothetical protein